MGTCSHRACLRDLAAPPATCRRVPIAATRRTRHFRSRRCDDVGRRGTHRTARRRGTVHTTCPSSAQAAVAPRDADRSPRGRRPFKPRYRGTALSLSPHGRLASVSHLSEAGHHVACATLRATRIGVRVTLINRDDERIAIGSTTASEGGAPDLPFGARTPTRYRAT